MKKFILAISVCAFFAGCAGTSYSGGREVRQGEKGRITFDDVNNNKIVDAKPIGNVVKSEACENGNTQMCRSFADSMYQKGDFASAIAAYDANCDRQDIVSCVKVANMFEKGEGIQKNIYNAIDIHMRACYGGYSPSCKDMKRLGYEG